MKCPNAPMKPKCEQKQIVNYMCTKQLFDDENYVLLPETKSENIDLHLTDEQLKFLNRGLDINEPFDFHIK